MNSTTQHTGSTTLPWSLKILFFIAGQIGSIILLIPCIFIFENSSIAYALAALISFIVAIVLTRAHTNERIHYAFVLPCLLNAYSLTVASRITAHGDTRITIFIILILAIVNLFLIKNPFFRKLHILAILALVPCLCCPEYDDKHIVLSGFQVIYMGILFCLVVYEEAITTAFKEKVLTTVFKEENIATIPEKVKEYLSAIRFSLVVTAIAMTGSKSIILSVIYAVGSFALSCVLIHSFVHQEKKIIGSVLLALLCCSTTAVSPDIALSLLGFLLSYMVYHYAGMLLFGGFFLWSIIHYYYNMELSLAYKSYLLMGSGIALLLLFYYLKRISK